MSITNGHAPIQTMNDHAALVTTADGSVLTHEQWLEERKKDYGIGASETAVVAGLTGSVVKLWYTKKKLITDDFVATEQMKWGTRLEPLIAQAWSEATGETLVSQQLFIRHQEYPWIFCTLDRLTIDGGIVELKAMSNFGNDAEDGFGFNPDSPPAKWIVQAQQQMACTGEDVVRFAVFYGPELALKECTIRKDEAMWAHLLGLLKTFRQSLIDGTPPTDFVADDAALVGKIYRGKVEGPELELSDAKLLEAAKAFVSHSDLADREKAKDKAKAAILQALGTSTKATIAGYTLIRKSTAKQTRIEVLPPAPPSSEVH
jgi:putative phage-type endonuclease